ncbi:hypothetical protein M422DRAFT_267697 [Sphaerobolus stellatus SS14]|uniref:Uncharacterized protein n=1 Tax=Sphaerobolus stellatus (strain SS14) TaxID=990650 RepID=A0A0C9UZZ2_SPHS4|nr:hypothetical protein M422DRAFT_267697 [Sphaerobolus stellatus SS14]
MQVCDMLTTFVSPSGAPSSAPSGSFESSEGVPPEICKLDIPPPIIHWASDIIRPKTLPSSYDKILNLREVFYIPSKEQYVIAKPCNLCVIQSLPCDEEPNGCMRCTSLGGICKRDPGYTALPPAQTLKMAKNNRSATSEIADGYSGSVASDYGAQRQESVSQLRRSERKVKYAPQYNYSGFLQEFQDVNTSEISIPPKGTYAAASEKVSSSTLSISPSIYTAMIEERQPQIPKKRGRPKKIPQVAAVIPIVPNPESIVRPENGQQVISGYSVDSELSKMKTKTKPDRKKQKLSDIPDSSVTAGPGDAPMNIPTPPPSLTKPVRSKIGPKKQAGQASNLRPTKTKAGTAGPWSLMAVDSISIPNPGKDHPVVKLDPRIPWARDREDLLAAIPTLKDILEAPNFGVGCEGGAIEYLVLEGDCWEGETWDGRSALNVSRKWFYSMGTSRAKGKKGRSSKQNIADVASLPVASSLEQDRPVDDEELMNMNISPILQPTDLILPPMNTDGLPQAMTNDLDEKLSPEDSQNQYSIIRSSTPFTSVSGETAVASEMIEPLSLSPNAYNSASKSMMFQEESYTSLSTMTLVGDDIPIPEPPKPSLIPHSLPLEVELFHTAHRIMDPIRIIIRRDLRFIPFGLPKGCSYAVLGIFSVEGFELLRDQDGTGASIVTLKLKLKWLRNPIYEPTDQDAAPSQPWWLSSLPLLQDESTKVDPAEFEEIKYMVFFPYIPFGPIPHQVERTTEDDIMEIVSESRDWPSAWICKQCGKLQRIVLFQCKWPLSCDHCGLASTQKPKPKHLGYSFTDLSALPPVARLPEEGVVQKVIYGKENSFTFIYIISTRNIVFEHTPQYGQKTHLKRVSRLFDEMQIDTIFQPAPKQSRSIMLFHDLPNAKVLETAPKSSTEAWNIMKELIMGLSEMALDLPVTTQPENDKLHFIECKAWTSKGTTKDINMPSNKSMLLSLGAAMMVKFEMSSGEGRRRGEMRSFQMTHGSKLFVVADTKLNSFTVQHSGPSILLIGSIGV